LKGVRKLVCSRCGGVNDRLPQRYCKFCHAANMRSSRPRHSELSDLQKKKANTRSYSKELLKRGDLKRGVCEYCHSAKVEMHHDDYNDPCNVRWFCRSHHLLYHKWKNILNRFHEEPCVPQKIAA
jgi:hypothetical protein